MGAMRLPSHHHTTPHYVRRFRPAARTFVKNCRTASCTGCGPSSTRRSSRAKWTPRISRRSCAPHSGSTSAPGSPRGPRTSRAR
ncbi:hypothetical protein ACH3WN_32380 [Streptomyces albogriseolus]|uniref:hypothetical protein n=1 Tax=Streptomyces albogriseolus TaxID=1887 RepID=UPI0037B8945F